MRCSWILFAITVYSYKDSEVDVELFPCSERDTDGPFVETHKFVTDLTVASGNDWYAETVHVYGHHHIGNPPTSNRYPNLQNDLVPGPLKTFSILEPAYAGGCADHKQAVVIDTCNGHNRKCVIALNAGLFNVTDSACLGHLVADSELIQSTSRQNAAFGIMKSGYFATGYMKREWIEKMEFSQLINGVIWLVRNGKSYVETAVETESSETQTTGSLRQFANVRSARTAIGHDQDGNLIIVQIDGQTYTRGLNLYDFSDWLIKEIGMINAINLDGGGSVSLFVNGTEVNYPSDHCPNSSKWRCARHVSSVICIACPTDCGLHGACDQNGNCNCNLGWTGDHCETSFCPPSNCSRQGVCDQDGVCDCSIGFTGRHCQYQCNPGFWGKNCNQICQCLNGGYCHPTKGDCICSWGVVNQLCSQPCKEGNYGPNCKYNCPFNQPNCNAINGSLGNSAQSQIQFSANRLNTYHSVFAVSVGIYSFSIVLFLLSILCQGSGV